MTFIWKLPSVFSHGLATDMYCVSVACKSFPSAVTCYMCVYTRRVNDWSSLNTYIDIVGVRVLGPHGGI